MKEEWKQIDELNGLYQVSNLGNVRRVFVKGMKMLKPCADKDGYLFVFPCINGVDKRMSVHRLVATAFICNDGNLPTVNHKDEVKTNNCVDNLEWCTYKYNANYGTRNERISRTKRARSM